MNSLFLLLPMVGDNENVLHPYLKNYTPKDSDEIKLFIKQLFCVLSIIDHERYSGYFDNGILASFYRFVKKEVGDEAAVLLMTYLNDWMDYRQMEGYVPAGININGVDLKGGELLDSCIQCGAEGVAVINMDALCGHPKSLRMSGVNGDIGKISFLACDEKVLYKWFVENRNPQRVLDTNYKKHGLFAKEGYRGIISPLTYNYEEASAFLHKAVSGKGESKRLGYWLKKEHKVLIFFNENLPGNSTYHAYEIAENQHKEWNKLSTATQKKIKRVADW